MLLLHHYSVAQTKQLYATLLDAKDNRPVPFAVITTEWGTQYLSGIDGTFYLNENKKIEYITIRTPYYLTQTAAVISDTMTFVLQKKQLQPLHKTDERTQAIIKNVLENKFLHNPYELQGLAYETYNKTYITTEDSRQAKKQLKKTFRFLFSKDSTQRVRKGWHGKVNRFFDTMKRFDRPHHFFFDGNPQPNPVQRQA